MSDLKLALRLTVENGQFKAAITDAQGQVQRFGSTAKGAGAQAAGGFDQVTAAAVRARRSFVENTASIRDQLQGLQNALLGGLALKSVIEAADLFKSLQARILNASNSSAEFTERSQQLFDLAQANGQSLEATVQLYTRVAGAVRELNGSTRDALRLTDLTAKAFRLSGAGAAEAAGATIQLAQALQSGVVRGDEFNSINEQGGRLIQALADGLGVARGSLRAMAEAGQLTSDKVLPALLSQMEAINREAQNLPDTVGQALTRLGNAFLAATDQAQGLQGALAAIRAAAGGAAASPTLIGVGIDLAATAAATFGIGRLVRILTEAARAAGSARVALAGLAAFFGGPVVAGIGAVVAVGLTLVNLFADKTPKAIEVEKTQVQKLIEKYQALKAAKEGVAPVRPTPSPGLLQERRLLEDLAGRNQRTITTINERLSHPRRGDTPADTLQFQVLAEQAQERLKVLQFGIQSLNQQIADAPYAAAEAKLDEYLKGVQTKAQAAQQKLQEYRDLLIGTRRQEDPALVARILASGREPRPEKPLDREPADDSRQTLDAQIADEIAAEDSLRQEQTRRRRELNIALLDAEGQDQQAALQRLLLQYEEHLVEIGESATGADLARRLFDASKAKVQLDAIKDEVESVIRALQDRVAARDRRSQFVEPGERNRLQRDNATDVQQTQGQLDAIAAREGGAGAAVTEIFDRAREGVRGLADDIARASEGPIAQLFRDWREGTLAMEQAAAGWISSTADGITELVTSGKANFRDLADSIIKDLIRIQIRAAIAGLVGTIFPEFSAVGQSSASGSGGGSLNFTGLAGGGPVRGPGGPTDDQIPARLSNGEYVIRAASVQKFGRQFFDSLNAGFAPPSAARRFAAGGLVGAVSGGGSASGAPTIQIINQGEPMKAGPVERGRTPDGRDLYRLLVEPQIQQDLGGNGPIAKSLSGMFGLSRRGGRSGN